MSSPVVLSSQFCPSSRSSSVVIVRLDKSSAKAECTSAIRIFSGLTDDEAKATKQEIKDALVVGERPMRKAMRAIEKVFEYGH